MIPAAQCYLGWQESFAISPVWSGRKFVVSSASETDMSLNAYLFFDGNCEGRSRSERSVGAQRDALMRYEENPAAGCPGMHANFGGKIMHAKLRIGGDELLLADDCMGHPVFRGSR